MTRLAHLHLALTATAAAIAYAPADGPMGGGPLAPAKPDLMSSRVAFMVHKEGQEDILQISPHGRILNDMMDRPEWDNDVVLALLSERTDFYTSRLGADLAAPFLTTNLINFDDLAWVFVNEETGLEDTLQADDELRQKNLALALGMDRETGDIEGSVNEVHIDLDSKGYTAEELAARNAVDEAVEAKPASANGTV